MADMPTTEGRLMPSISDDVRAIEEALAAGPTPGPWAYSDERKYTPDEPYWIGVNDPECGFISHAVVRSGCDEADALGDMEANAKHIAACDPARLRRVLDTMKAMGEALRPFVGATLSEQGHVIGLMREDFAKAVAAMALYEGWK